MHKIDLELESISEATLDELTRVMKSLKNGEAPDFDAFLAVSSKKNTEFTAPALKYLSYTEAVEILICSRELPPSDSPTRPVVTAPPVCSVKPRRPLDLGNGSGCASIPFRAAPRTVGRTRESGHRSPRPIVFVSRVDASVDASSMLDYCRSLSSHVRSVSKFKPDDSKNFASFVIRVDDGHTGDLLRPEIWDVGMVFKLYTGFLNPDRLLETVHPPESS